VLSGTAVAQLAAWEAIAEDWPVVLDAEGIGRCGACGQGVLMWIDRTGAPYRYSHEQVLSLTVLHLRNRHADLDPDHAPRTL
jgi:hypothetical protein